MAVITREEVIPSPVENVTVVKLCSDGVHRRYELTANDGYVLHDKANDYADFDPATMTETPVLGYAAGTVSCSANYDFNATTVIEGYTAHGSREFFARPESEVPENQIFGGGGNNDHEIA